MSVSSFPPFSSFRASIVSSFPPFSSFRASIVSSGRSEREEVTA